MTWAHEPPEFAALRTVKSIAGHQVTGWFAEEFSLAQVKHHGGSINAEGLRPT